MSKEEKKGFVPERRFPEFEGKGEWAVRELGEFISTITPPTKLLTSDYLAEGQFPIIDQSQSYICGWTNDNDAIIDDHLPLIVFGDHTCVLKLINQPFAQGADGIKIIKPNNSVQTEFLYQSLQFKPLVMEQYKRHFSILRERKVAYPDRKTGEQQKIADCLTSVDELITTQVQKFDALKTHREGLMQQLFPAEGETVPKLRFPEFRDKGEWEVKILSQVCEINPSANALPESFVYIDLESVEAGRLLKKNLISREGSPSRAQRLLKFGDVIFQMVRPYQKNNYYFLPDDDLDYVASTGYAQLRANESSRYLFQYLHNDRFVARVLSKCTGSNYPAINSSSLSEILVEVPQPEEQQKIADCLTSIDELISNQAKKVEALKAHKKGLMQQLFPTMDEVSA